MSEEVTLPDYYEEYELRFLAHEEIKARGGYVEGCLCPTCRARSYEKTHV